MTNERSIPTLKGQASSRGHDVSAAKKYTASMSSPVPFYFPNPTLVSSDSSAPGTKATNKTHYIPHSRLELSSKCNINHRIVVRCEESCIYYYDNLCFTFSPLFVVPIPTPAEVEELCCERGDLCPSPGPGSFVRKGVCFFGVPSPYPCCVRWCEVNVSRIPRSTGACVSARDLWLN